MLVELVSNIEYEKCTYIDLQNTVKIKSTDINKLEINQKYQAKRGPKMITVSQSIQFKKCIINIFALIIQ